MKRKKTVQLEFQITISFFFHSNLLLHEQLRVKKKIAYLKFTNCFSESQNSNNYPKKNNIIIAEYMDTPLTLMKAILKMNLFFEFV